jgi:hypothetical protein
LTACSNPGGLVISFDTPDLAEESSAGIKEAVYEEIAAGADSGLGASRTEQKESPFISASLTEFPKVTLSSFLQESQGSSQTPAGKWSPKTQETWQKLFDDVSKIPGMTAGRATEIFNDLGPRINDQ